MVGAHGNSYSGIYSHKLQDSIQILEGKIGFILGPVWMQLFDWAPYFKVILK